MIVYDTLNLGGWQTGLTVTATVYPHDGGSALTIAMPESPAGSARYVLQRADDNPLPGGVYDYTAADADGNAVGSGLFDADDAGLPLNFAALSSALADVAADALSAATNAMTAAAQATAANAKAQLIGTAAVASQADVQAGGGQVAVIPLTVQAAADLFRLNGGKKLNLSCHQAEAASWQFSITDSLGEVVDLSGEQLRFVVYDANYADAFAVESDAGVVVNDDLSVTVQLSTTDTNRRDYTGSWILWQLSPDKPIGSGQFKIVGAVKDVT